MDKDFDIEILREAAAKGTSSNPLWHFNAISGKGAIIPLLEEQFDLPPAPIQLGDGDRRQCEIVGQEHKPLAGLGIFEFDTTQWRVEVLARIEPCEHATFCGSRRWVTASGDPAVGVGFPCATRPPRVEGSHPLPVGVSRAIAPCGYIRWESLPYSRTSRSRGHQVPPAPAVAPAPCRPASPKGVE